MCDIAKHANLDIKKGKFSLTLSCKKNLSVLLTAEYCVVYINVQIYIIFFFQQPEEIREKRKRLYDIQKKYSAKNVETKIKGDKLIFTKSGNVYRDKTGTRPTAEEVISGDQVRITVNKGKHIEDNQNRFESHATAVNSYKQVKESLIEILRLPTISSASHNVYAYRFAGSDGMVHEGSEDDGEHGAGRTLLSAMNDNGIQNALIVVSRWFGNKIGMRRFTHIVDAGLSAGKNINPS